MPRRLNSRPLWLLPLAIIAVLSLPLPAFAQAMLKGVVKDDKGQLIEGAKVTMEMVGGTGRKFETKSDKKGEFIQIGMPTGSYSVTAEKDKLVSAPLTLNVSVRVAGTAELIISAAGGRAAQAAQDSQQKSGELRKLFDEGVADARAGKHDEAIDMFTKAAAVNANCFDCYSNMGYSYVQKKDYDKAEASYKKAIELKPDYADAYAGLSTVYNAERKFDLASDAAAKATQYGSAAGAGAGAAGGGSADALYNQGVILWNAGKIPDAQKQFEAAIQANPNHAESHYQLGMALVNEGNTAGAATEFETYLKLAPTGPNAATAKALMDQLKK